MSIHEIFTKRKSQRAFADKPVSPETMTALFDAARWAPSSYNDQPWRFIYAHKEDKAAFEKLLSCANEWNYAWAKNAAVILVSVAKLHFDHNGAPNKHAWHDVGMAMQNLALQGAELGLNVHQMAGFDPDKVKRLYNLPDGYEAVALTAIGYFGNPESLPEPYRDMEKNPRQRKPVSDFAFRNEWKP